MGYCRPQRTMLFINSFALLLLSAWCVHSAPADKLTLFNDVVDLDKTKDTHDYTGCAQVAFFARMKNTVRNVGINQNIVFEDVVLNKGGDYHSHHGIFFAPTSGLYEFSCTLSGYNTHVYGEIVHNGNTVSSIHGYAYNGYSGTDTVIIQAKRGDSVWVKNVINIAGIRGDYYSTFSGHLLC